MRERLGASEAEVERIVDGDEPPTTKMNAGALAVGKGKKKKARNESKEEEEGEWNG